MPSLSGSQTERPDVVGVEPDQAIAALAARAERAERALAHREAALATILAHVPSVVTRYDRDLRMTYVSPAFTRLTGRPTAEFLGRRIDEVGYPADATARLAALIGRAFAEGVPLSGEFTLTFPDRTSHYFVDLAPERDEAGEVVAVVGVSTDLTATRRADEALARREREFRALVENAPDVIARFDRAGKRLYVNPAVTRQSGQPPEAYIGKTLAEVGSFAPEQQEVFTAAMARAFETGRQATCDLRFERHDGWRYLEARIEPEPGPDGQIETVIAVVRDVTDLKSADRYKDEFFSVVSHELRTPLNFITGFASLLDDGAYGELDAPQRHAVGRILGGADRMLRLVNDMLDFSRVSAGALTLQTKPMALGPLVEEVAEAMQALAKAKGLKLTADAPADVEATVDGGRLVQVLTNLVDNAIKFTPTGGHVAIALRTGLGAHTIEVRDTGRGIAADQLPRIFQRFSQLDMSTTRDAGGAGLGLSIAKALVEAHDGRLEVESEPGVGSVFRVVLPTG